MLKLALILGSVEAIALGPVPLEWMALILLIGAGAWNWRSLIRVQAPGLYWLAALILWAVLVSCFNAIKCSAVNCHLEMPSGATTSYHVYVALRFFVLLAFVSAYLLASKMIQDRREELIRFIVTLGTVAACIAIYVYIAQLYGFPDIPRTRLGTDGMQVTEVAFSYAFHRALGTFREPSHMAAWLALPFLLSLSKVSWRSVLMGGVLLLSGSLTAFVAISAGSLAAWLFLIPRYRRSRWMRKLPFVFTGLLALAFIPFMLLASGDKDLLGVVVERAGPIFEFGIEESNRGYIYEYARETDIPIIGSGLGNSSLELTRWMQSNVMSGFLSLYLITLYSLGIVGLGILVLFLAKPLFMPLKFEARESWPLYASYFAWLIMFSIHAAEVPVMFALTYALISQRRLEGDTPQTK